MNNFDVDWFEFELENSVMEATLLYEDFKKKGLTFGTFEAEGYLRAMLTIQDAFQDIKKRSNKENI
jgi:hypothetical protein